MPSYTMTFREAIEFSGGRGEFENGRMVLKDTNIGLEHYPIFDEAHRTVLNSHIAGAYWNCEIAHEAREIFQLRLAAHMNLHMPLFNERYKLRLMEFDPLKTMDIRTTANTEGEQDGLTTSKSQGDSKSEAGNRNVFSDMPGNMLKGDADYASNATDATAFTDGSSTSEDEATTLATNRAKSDNHSIGYSGAPADIIRRAQEALLNVDLMVVQSLEPLFLALWSSSDEYPVKGGY